MPNEQRYSPTGSSAAKRIYHLQDFENAFAILSEEEVAYLLYSCSGPEFESGIQTSAEPLGNVP